MMRST